MYLPTYLKILTGSFLFSACPWGGNGNQGSARIYIGLFLIMPPLLPLSNH
jgi:hypothetical protein